MAVVPANQVLARIAGLLGTQLPAPQDLLRHSAGRCVTLTFCSPLSVRVAQRDSLYLADLATFDHVHPDGMLLAAVASRLRGLEVPRASFDGNSVAPEFLRAAAAAGVPVALVGGRDPVACQAGEVFAREFGVRVVYCRHGYFGHDADVLRTIAELRASGARFVIVGMGIGPQERFICRLRDSGWQGLVASCGGYLDQVVQGNSARYYPDWVNRFNLRAPFRLLHEPMRLLPRYTTGYLPFYRAALAFLAGRVRRG